MINTNLNLNYVCYDTIKMLFVQKRNVMENIRTIKNEYFITASLMKAIHNFLVNEHNYKYSASNVTSLYYTKDKLICFNFDSESEIHLSDSIKSTVTVEFVGEYFEVASLEAEIIKKFNIKLKYSFSNTNAQWAFRIKGDIDYTTVKTKLFDIVTPELYPYISDIGTYIDDFANSSQNILILTGEPGLGKTSFIKYILKQTSWIPTISYDEEVIGNDVLYIDFINNQNSDVLILEDADVMLKSRIETQNKIMSKILNVSDGLIDFSGKKFIFTANIENIRDIDAALIRPGRCYDVLKFRHLTKEEASKAAEAIGKKLEIDKDKYTLAEIFMNKTNDENIKNIPSTGFGFNA